MPHYNYQERIDGARSAIAPTLKQVQGAEVKLGVDVRGHLSAHLYVGSDCYIATVETGADAMAAAQGDEAGVKYEQEKLVQWLQKTLGVADGA